MQVTISVLAVLMLSISAQASKVQRKVSSIECTFVKWPYADQKIGKEQIALLRHVDRNRVRSFYLNEITTTPVQKELAYGLYDFLISTEPNENIRAFLELTSYSADLKTDHPRALDKKEICDIAQHVSVDLPKN